MVNDLEFLARMDGKRWRSEIEFEEQCYLRSYQFKGCWSIDNSNVVRVNWTAVMGDNK